MTTPLLMKTRIQGWYKILQREDTNPFEGVYKSLWDITYYITYVISHYLLTVVLEFS